MRPSQPTVNRATMMGMGMAQLLLLDAPVVDDDAVEGDCLLFCFWRTFRTCSRPSNNVSWNWFVAFATATGPSIQASNRHLAFVFGPGGRFWVGFIGIHKSRLFVRSFVVPKKHPSWLLGWLIGKIVLLCFVEANQILNIIPIEEHLCSLLSVLATGLEVESSTNKYPPQSLVSKVH